VNQGLWDWAVAAYARPGVSEACLTLQDGHDHNVPYLLWAAWAALRGSKLDADTLEAGVDTARAWDSAAVRPLRVIRTTLKKPIPDLDDEAREAVRAQIKAVELEAERRLLLALESLTPALAGPGLALTPALVDAARAFAPVIPRAALEGLAAKLSG
jgi:uncharacterized protein (TIGR02444 family)